MSRCGPSISPEPGSEDLRAVADRAGCTRGQHVDALAIPFVPRDSLAADEGFRDVHSLGMLMPSS